MIIIMAVINLILKNQTDITIAKNSHDIVLVQGNPTHGGAGLCFHVVHI